jgi:ribosome-binding factor A
MPHLRFVYDSSMAEGVRMSALVDKAVASDNNDQNNDDEANSPDSQQDE